MTDLTNDERAQNEHALDPDEKWGQGTDASHPISAIGGVSADIPTAAEATGTTEESDARDLPDDMPLA